MIRDAVAAALDALRHELPPRSEAPAPNPLAGVSPAVVRAIALGTFTDQSIRKTMAAALPGR